MYTGALRSLDVGEGRFGKREPLVVKLKSIVIQYARFALLRTYVAGELRMCFGGGGHKETYLQPRRRIDLILTLEPKAKFHTCRSSAIFLLSAS